MDHKHILASILRKNAGYLTFASWLAYARTVCNLTARYVKRVELLGNGSFVLIYNQN